MASGRFYLCHPQSANLYSIKTKDNPQITQIHADFLLNPSLFPAQSRASGLTQREPSLYTLRQLLQPECEIIVKLHLANLGDTQLFTGYAADHVMVNRVRFDTSIVVMAEEVRTDWAVTGFDALSEVGFEYFLAIKPEVLLLGTGARQHFPHPRLYRALTNAGIGVECMDTPAACRTYNILVEEDRKVVAAILL